MSAIQQKCAVQIFNDPGQDVDLIWGGGCCVWGSGPSYTHDSQRNCCAGQFSLVFINLLKNSVLWLCLVYSDIFPQSFVDDARMGDLGEAVDISNDDRKDEMFATITW